LHTKEFLKVLILFNCLLIFTLSTANSKPSVVKDSVNIAQDSSIIDTTSLFSDSLFFKDTIKEPNQNNSVLEDKVEYNAKDSIIYLLTENKVLLYGEANIKYEDIELTAAYIDFNMDKNTVFAEGIEDSAGVIQGSPIFKEGSESFEADKITYNFDTEKGLIKRVFSQQQGGYLHGRTVKRHQNKHVHMKFGKYTTCDKPNPHFYIAMTKAEVIPDDKIIAGPSYLVIEDVPIYFIGLPFGFFPNTKKNSSGIIIPEYGEEENRGFFLRNMGYYFALNDYMDLTITGDIYSKGTWGVGVQSNYNKRYKFTGNLTADYYEEVKGEKFDDVSDESGLGNYSVRQDVNFQWRHSQSAKANPFSSFGANVDFSSTSYDERYSYSTERYLRNSKSSNISYQRRWANSPFSLSANLRHSQNSRTQEMDLQLPQLSLTMNRLYPLRSKKSSGQFKWYEKIQIGYSADVQNNVNTYDTVLFNDIDKAFAKKNLDRGFTHSMPVSINFNPIKFVTFRPQLSYKGVMYDRYITKDTSHYDPVTDSNYFHVVEDTTYGLTYGHTISPSLNLGFNPKIYGMFQSINPNAKISALRHVISPSVSFSYVPKLENLMPDYYNEVYTDSLGKKTQTYSRFQRGIYGTPGVPKERGILSFGINNNIEMKIRNDKDTAEAFNKIKIIDYLGINSSYDVFADSMNLSNIRMSGGTRLIDDKIDLRVTGVLNPYVYKKDVGLVDKYVWDNKKGKLGRLTNFTTSLSASFNSRMFQNKDKTEDTEETQKRAKGIYDYFNMSWSFRFSYDFTYSKPNPFVDHTIKQTLGFSGNTNLTPNWRIGFRSGYDFERKELSYTSLNIYRDLHCWEMRMRVSPFGRRKFYTFQINVKSSVLQDLKYEKKKDPRDY
jgi:lipopolysaccharide assembly outer membrane protein LptD (OstA)